MNEPHTMLQTVYQIANRVKSSLSLWRQVLALGTVLTAPLFLRFINGGVALNPQLEPLNITRFNRTSGAVVVEWEGAIPPYKLQYGKEAVGVWRGGCDREVLFRETASSARIYGGNCIDWISVLLGLLPPASPEASWLAKVVNRLWKTTEGSRW